MQGTQEGLTGLERLLGPAALFHFFEESQFTRAFLFQTLTHDAIHHTDDEENRDPNEMALQKQPPAHREIEHDSVESGNDRRTDYLQPDTSHRGRDEND